MGNVNTKAELVDLLENIRAVEVIARRGYADDTLTFKNLEIVNAIEKIRKEEDNHIARLDALLDMLKKNRWTIDIK